MALSKLKKKTNNRRYYMRHTFRQHEGSANTSIVNGPVRTYGVRPRTLIPTIREVKNSGAREVHVHSLSVRGAPDGRMSHGAAADKGEASEVRRGPARREEIKAREDKWKTEAPPPAD